ncbi:MAG TPA: STAS domain-containing protein [Actinocrinis sp.]
MTSTTTGTAAIIRISGEIDLATAEAAAAALVRAAATLPPPRIFVLDLTDVGFLSVAGARMVHRFASGCADRGLDVRLVADPNSIVPRIFRYLLVDVRRGIFDSVEQALLDS